MNRSLPTLAVAVALLSATALSAATYHVTREGEDSNPGIESLPWRTLQKAADTMLPGDAVLVHPGFYAENVKVTRSGNASGRITYQATGGVTNHGFQIFASHITVDGFDVSGAPVPKWGSAIHLGPTAHHARIINNHLHHLTNIYGVRMVSSGKGPEHGPQSCIISNNVFDHIGYINVNLFGTNHWVVSNVFANSFGEGDAVRAWGAGHRIVGNVFTNIGGGAPAAGGHADLIQTFGDWDQPAYDIVFERNYAVNCLSQFCQLEQKGVKDIRDWIFRNNIFIRVVAAANCDLPGVWWFNNVFYQCTTNLAHVISFADATNPKGAAWRSGAKNNVFLECGSKPHLTTYGWYLAPTNLVDLDCDYNYVAGPRFAYKRWALVRTTWRFVEAHGINGGDPGFVSIAELDFRLAPGSSLIDAGTPIPSFAGDFLDKPRGNGAGWDIGAYEFSP